MVREKTEHGGSGKQFNNQVKCTVFAFKRFASRRRCSCDDVLMNICGVTVQLAVVIEVELDKFQRETCAVVFVSYFPFGHFLKFALPCGSILSICAGASLERDMETQRADSIEQTKGA